MQTVRTHNTAVTIARPAAQSKGRAFLKMLVRKSDMIGVMVVMGSTAVYAASQLMTLAR